VWRGRTTLKSRRLRVATMAMPRPSHTVTTLASTRPRRHVGVLVDELGAAGVVGAGEVGHDQLGIGHGAYEAHLGRWAQAGLDHPGGSATTGAGTTSSPR